MTEAEAAALDAVSRGRWAWVAQVYLAASGHDPATLTGLIEKGLLVPWDTPPDPACLASPAAPPCGLVLTLTPYGAERLGVEVVEAGPAERPRWERIRYDERGRRTDRGKPAIRAFRYESRLRLPELIPDTAPGPEYYVDEESGKPIRLAAGPDAVEIPKEESTLKGGLGGGPAERGVPIVKDKKLKGKR